MKHLSTILLLTAPLSSFAEDKPKEYQVGTYWKQSKPLIWRWNSDGEPWQ
jgi:hypothetical protein